MTTLEATPQPWQPMPPPASSPTTPARHSSHLTPIPVNWQVCYSWLGMEKTIPYDAAWLYLHRSDSNGAPGAQVCRPS